MMFYCYLIIALQIGAVCTRLYPDWKKNMQFANVIEVCHGDETRTVGKSPSSGYELGSAIRSNFFDMTSMFIFDSPEHYCYLTQEDSVAPEEVFPYYTADMIKMRPMSQWHIQVSESRDSLMKIDDAKGTKFYHAFFPHVKETMVVNGQMQYTMKHRMYFENYLRQVRDETIRLSAWDRWHEYAPLECNPLQIAGTGVTEAEAPIYSQNQVLVFRASLNAPQCTVDGGEPCSTAKWGIFYRDHAKCQIYQRFDEEYFYKDYSPSLNNEEEEKNIWKTLSFNANILPVGTFMLLLTNVDDPSNPLCHFYAQGWFRVIESQLVGVVDPVVTHTLETILDGSDVNLTLPRRKTLFLNAARTYDPYGLVKQDEIMFKWRCVYLGTDDKCYFFNWHLEGHKRPIIEYNFFNIPSQVLHYSVQPVVRGRTGPWKSKLVTVVEYEIVQVAITALENGLQKIVPNKDLLLHVSWQMPLSYTWGVALGSSTSSPLPDSAWLSCCPMGKNLDTFWLNPGCLLAGQTYTIFVEGYDINDYIKGEASYTREVATDVTAGTCDIQPRSGVSVVTMFMIHCVGFVSADLLKYTLYRGTVLLYVSDLEDMVLTFAPGAEMDNFTISDLHVRVSTEYQIDASVNISSVQVFLPSLEERTFWIIFQSGIAFSMAVDSVLSAINLDDVTDRLPNRTLLREEIVMLLMEESLADLDRVLLMSARFRLVLNRQSEISDTVQDYGVKIAQLLSQTMSEVTVSSERDYQEASKNIILGCEALIRLTKDQILRMKQTTLTVQSPQLQHKNGLNKALVRVMDGEILRMTQAAVKTNTDPIVTDTLSLNVMKTASNVSNLHFSHSVSSLTMPDIPLTNLMKTADNMFTGSEVMVQMLYMESSLYTWNTYGPDPTAAMIQLSLTTDTLDSLEVYYVPEPVNVFLKTNADADNPQLADIYLLQNEISVEIIEFVSRSDVNTLLHIYPRGNFSVLAAIAQNSSYLTHLEILNTGTIFPQADDTLQKSGDLTQDANIWIIPPCEDCDSSNAQLMYLGITVHPNDTDLMSENTLEADGNLITGLSVIVQQIQAACLYWSVDNEFWASDGCQMTPFTTLETIHCQCNHLTAFSASFFIMPNIVDPIDTVALFSTFFDNPVVVVTVAVIWFIYISLLLYVYKKDRNDWIQLGAVDLPDNESKDTYGYLVGMVTGWWHGAGTSANVYCSIQGTDGASKKHALAEISPRPHFQAGMEDWFILRTPRSLGTVKYISIWHDNGGKSPAWFLKQVTVQDLQENTVWHFLYNNWLDVKRGPTNNTKAVLPALDSKQFTKNVLYQLSMKSSKTLRDEHIWFSIFFKPPGSSFTRAQRLTCGLVLLLTAMLTSLMFHGIPTDDPEDQIKTGDLHVSLSDVVIGIQCGLIMFPINMIIVQLFSRTAPSTSSGEFEPEDVHKPRSGVSQFERWKQKREFGFQYEVKKMEKGEVTAEKGGRTKEKKPFMLPSWFIYVAWIVAILTSLVCSYFVMLYGLMYGYQQSLVWFTSFFLAFFQSTFVQEPVKVIVVAFVITMLLKRPIELETFGPLPTGPEYEEVDLTEEQKKKLEVRIPLQTSSKKRLLHLLQLQTRTQELLKELVVYFTFVLILLFIVYGHRSIDQGFYYTSTVTDLFINGAYEDTMPLEEVATTDDMWEFIETSIVAMSQPHEDNLTRDGVSFLVGLIRLRQKRLQAGSCRTPDFMMDHFPNKDCVISFSEGTEYTGPLTCTNKANWTYFSAWDLKTLPFTGEHATYSGGGYIIDLPKNADESSKVLENTQKLGWVNDKTRAVFVEFSLYNPNVNLFSIVTILFEFTNVGQIYPSFQVFTSKLFHYSNEFESFVAACEVLFIIYMLIFIYTEIKKVRKYGRKMYFSDVWNITEIVIIFLAISAVALFANRMIVVNNISEDYRTSGDKTFINFYVAMFWDFMLVCVLAFLVLLTILKFLKLFQYNRKTAMLSETLSRARVSIFTFAIAILCISTAFAQFGVLVFGQHVGEYRNFSRALIALFMISLGESDYGVLEESHQIFGPIYFFLVNLIIINVFLNLFISAVMFAFEDTRNDLNKIKCEVKMVKYLIAHVADLIPFGKKSKD